MKSLVIPSIFTAVDKFSGPVNGMAKNSSNAFARMQRDMRKAGQGAFTVGKNAAMVGVAILAPMALLAKSAVDFEEKMSNVATLIDTNTESIEDMGDSVLALATKLPVPIDDLTSSLYDIRSAGIVAEKSMETLEGAAKLSVAGLSSVEEATNISTSALNAFASEGLTAAQTNNILFKTVKAGKTTIAELAKSFGASTQQMSGAGVKLADFSAATAALTTTGVPASVAQTQLKASIAALLKPTAQMEKVFKGLGVTTGKELLANYDNLGEAFSAISSKSKELGVNTGKAWGSTEAFGATTALTTTLAETYIDTLGSMTDGVDDLGVAFDKQSKTGKAQMQLAKNNMESLSVTLGQAVIPMITMLVEAVTPVIQKFSKWSKENKGTLKTIMKVAAAIAGFAFAVSGASFAIGIAQKAMVIFNAVMSANPIALVIVGVLALGVALYGVYRAFNQVSTAQKLNNEVTSRALDNTIDQRVEVTMLFKALRKAEEGSAAYNSTLEKLEAMQPGIIEKYDLQTKSIEKINQAEKALIETIMQRAKIQAAEELTVEKTKAAITAEQEGPGWAENLLEMAHRGALAVSTLGSSEAFGFQENLIMSSEEKNQQKVEGLFNEADILGGAVAEFKAVNPEKSKQDSQNSFIEKTTKEQVTVKFENLPEGATVTGNGNNNFAMPSTGTTR